MARAKRSRTSETTEIEHQLLSRPAVNVDVDADTSNSEGERDDGYPWFGCICGKTHETFWIQCEICNTWYNSSPLCLGYDEHEAQRRGKWQCPKCSCISSSSPSSLTKPSTPTGASSVAIEDSSTSSSSGCVIRQQQIEADSQRNKEEKIERQHSIYTSDLELLDNTVLCAPLYVLTERSIAVCSRLITYFLLREDENSNFKDDLWVFVWNCMRYEQKFNGWELGWNSHLSNGTNGPTYYYIPKKSPMSNGKEGFDYFTSQEAVISYLCVVIKNSDKNAFDCIGCDDIQAFESKLTHAKYKNISYDDTKNYSLGTRSSSRSNRHPYQTHQYEDNVYQLLAKQQLGVTQNNTARTHSNVVAPSEPYNNQNQTMNDTEIIRLNQVLLNAIATSDLEKIASLCTKDTISCEQGSEFEDVSGGLVRGFTHDEVSHESPHNKFVKCNRIFMTNPFVKWQGEYNDVAVLSYTRHDIDGSFDESTRKEVRIWTSRNNTWMNTFTCTFLLCI